MQQRKLQREAEYARVLEQRVQERTRELSERQQELERVNNELAQASITDSLTGLANRRFLTEYIEKEVALLHRRYQRLSEGTMTTDLLDLAFVMIDIDNFKVVNDTAGHAAGDAVLRQFRDLLSSVARTSDIIVRWGGDEFLIVARDLSDEGQAELAERIRSHAEQHVFEVGEGRVIRTTCSVGFARYPFFKEQLDALTWEQVVSLADRGLYVAKASGRNAWVGFHPGLAALPIQGLFGAICHGIQQLVVDGTLRVTSSLREARALVWDSPRVKPAPEDGPRRGAAAAPRHGDDVLTSTHEWVQCCAARRSATPALPNRQVSRRKAMRKHVVLFVLAALPAGAAGESLDGNLDNGELPSRERAGSRPAPDADRSAARRGLRRRRRHD